MFAQLHVLIMAYLLTYITFASFRTRLVYAIFKQ